MKKIFIFIIKAYHKYISPLLPGACRFTPTCSVYTVRAIERFGVIGGLILGVWRILRCNPFCKGGYDPVPKKFTLKRQKVYTLANKYKDEVNIEQENIGEK